jgi:serine/threonine protein kinase
MMRRSNARKNHLPLVSAASSKRVQPSMLPITNRPLRAKYRDKKLLSVSNILLGCKLFAIIAMASLFRIIFRRTHRDRVRINSEDIIRRKMVHLNDYLPHLHEPEPRFVATPDYGGFNIQFLAEEDTLRSIDIEKQQEWEPHDIDIDENDIDTYYAFDDDIVRNPYSEYDDDSIRTSKHCRRVAWHRKLPINCNLIHELDFLSSIQDGTAEYAGEGAYRQVHLVQLDKDPSIAFKKYRWDASYDFRDLEFMRMDAVVAEVLSAEPDIVDIYGFCALAMVNEGILGGDLEDKATPIEIERGAFIENNRSANGPQPLNNLTATQKLVYSLEMAAALSKLHAYHGGVIVHDDIHLGQFLLDDFGHLKLQDFNRAEIMLWNEEDGEYCRYRNNPGDGEVRLWKFLLCSCSQMDNLTHFMYPTVSCSRRVLGSPFERED